MKNNDYEMGSDIKTDDIEYLCGEYTYYLHLFFCILTAINIYMLCKRNNIKNYVFFWSASSYSNKNAWYFCIYNNFSFVYRYNIEKPVGASVRCLKD